MQLELTFKTTGGELVAPMTREDHAIWCRVGRHNELYVARVHDKNDAVSMLLKTLASLTRKG